MKHLNYFAVVMLVLLMGCKSNTAKEMQSIRTVTDIFDKAEIKDLATIVDFFNAQICDEPKNAKADITKCYQSFFKRMEECEIKGDITVPVSFEAQQGLYSRISARSFNEIWAYNQHWARILVDSVLHDTYVTEIHLKCNGKYLQFLEKLGNENEVISDYLDALLSVGGMISPAHVAWVLKLYDQFDVKDLRFQIFIAIHYLTLNDYSVSQERVMNELRQRTQNAQ